MAFSYGFFNAKNLDRTYTAENFCDYLGSIICNGVACHAKRKKLTRKTKKTLLNTTFKSVFYYL